MNENILWSIACSSGLAQRRQGRDESLSAAPGAE